MKLTNAGRMTLWIGCGGFIGFAVGALLIGQASFFPLWLVGLALFLGIVLGLMRDRTATAPATATASAPAPAPRASRSIAVAPSTPDGLSVRFDFPAVPPGYPPVLGRGEQVQVKIQTFRAGQPSQGAAVQLSATLGEGSLSGDGLTGSEGEVEFTLEPEGIGELSLVAEAKSGASAGRASAVMTIVDYDDEIERLFGEFRAYAIGVLGAEAHTDTARELADKLRMRADANTARALLELARVYELVAYGERTADRRLYLAVLEQLLYLEQAELPDSTMSREV